MSKAAISTAGPGPSATLSAATCAKILSVKRPKNFMLIPSITEKMRVEHRATTRSWRVELYASSPLSSEKGGNQCLYLLRSRRVNEVDRGSSTSQQRWNVYYPSLEKGRSRRS